LAIFAGLDIDVGPDVAAIEFEHAKSSEADGRVAPIGFISAKDVPEVGEDIEPIEFEPAKAPEADAGIAQEVEPPKNAEEDEDIPFVELEPPKNLEADENIARIEFTPAKDPEVVLDNEVSDETRTDPDTTAQAQRSDESNAPLEVKASPGKLESTDEAAGDVSAARPVIGRGFATAAGSKLPVMTAEKLRAAENLFVAGGNDAAPVTPVKGAGFATAAGRKLPQVTEDKLKLSENFLDGSDLPKPPPQHPETAARPKAGAGFATATGKHLPKLTAEQMQATEGLFAAAESRPPTTFGGGFATATGTRLAIVSADKMAEADQFLGPDGASAAQQSDAAPKTVVPLLHAPKIGQHSFDTPKATFKKPIQIVQRIGPGNQFATPKSKAPSAKKADRRFTPFKAPTMVASLNGDGMPTPLATPMAARTPLSALSAPRQQLLHKIGSPALDSPLGKAPLKPVVPSFRSVFNVKARPPERTTLLQLATEEISILQTFYLPQEVLLMTPEQARLHEFATDEGGWGFNQAASELEACGADLKIVGKGWVANHYKWIVWKLACTARRFPRTLEFWNRQSVLNQLKYR
jgi:hypothetical protein